MRASAPNNHKYSQPNRTGSHASGGNQLSSRIFIPTYYGHRLNPFEPSPSEIDIRDIAHALSMDCRYGGHLIRHYSVAEHSVRLSYALSSIWENTVKYAKTGLMHDAAEAYLRDIPWPIKQSPIMKEYLWREDDLLEVILE